MKTQISGSNAVDKMFEWFDETTGEPLRILIAEDDTISRRVLEATLNGYGFKVSATSDGLEARQVLEGERPPSLAILDLCMPGMDGLDICRWIRAEPRLKSTYVILLTTRNSTGDVITGLQAGADDYITKPYDRAELRARIQVGMRVLAMQKDLAHQPCPHCGKLRSEPVAKQAGQ